VNQGYDISLDFSVDGDSYNITVSRRATLKCKLTKNGEDISSHTASNTYKTVLETLGIDFKTFTQLVYQNTNTSLQFLTATDTNRKKFLIDLLKLDDYVAFFETFKEAVRLTTQDVIKLNAKTDTIVKWLTDNKLETMTLLEKVNLPKISEKDEQELRSLQVRLENIHEKNRKINDNNNLLERLKSIDVEQDHKDLQKYEKIKPTSKLVSKIGGMKSRKEQELSMSKKYETLRNKPRSYDLKSKEAEVMTCPTCAQEIDMEFVNDQYDKHMLQVAGHTLAVTQVQEELEEIENSDSSVVSDNLLGHDKERLSSLIQNHLTKCFCNLSMTVC
jgi:DNA repair exonuclease SbcCD ATPase subunit